LKAKDLSDRLDLDVTPSGQEEELAYSEPDIYAPERWQDPDVRRKLLANQDFANDIKEKRRFAKFAYRVSGAWVAFLMIIIWCQAVPDWFGFELPEWAFGLVVGSLTLSVFGFAFLVGKYLFPEGGAKRN
jgi:hypothetical protein